MLPRRIFFTLALALAASLAAGAALPRGWPLPDLELPGPANTTISLRQYRGKPLIIALISTNCEHCVTTIQRLTEFYKEFHPRGLEILAGVADDDPPRTVPPFIARYRPGFAFSYITPDSFQKMANITPELRPFVPTLLFVDSRGMVRVRYFGNDPAVATGKLDATLRDLANQLLSERGAAKKK